MFSVIFPGQGSQIIGMGKDLYDRYDIVKKLFKEADEVLRVNLSKIIFEGPKEELDLTINTQPAIFLISYSIFKLAKEEFNKDLGKAKFFAGHSLGEYSALSCAKYLKFSDTIKILRARGDAMQNSVPQGEGGMIAILGSKIDVIEKILKEILNEKSIKNLKLPVSAPFHSKLMGKATDIMKLEIDKLNFQDGKNILISNVTAKEIENKDDLKKLLIEQIESRVRWRESVIYMISKGINQFIEIGPGKVLSNLVKRIDRKIEINTINDENDIKNLKI